MRRAAMLFVLLLAFPLVAPGAHAWFWDCEGRPHKPECLKEPATDPNEVIAYGRGGHHGLGMATTGDGVREYESCFFADLRPVDDTGHIVVAGLFNPNTAVDIRFEDWNNETHSTTKGIERDLLLRRENQGGLPLPELDVFAAGWGNATFEVNFEEYMDTVNGPPLSDEAEWNWTAMFFLTRNGVRNNDTKAMTNIGGADFDPERPRDVRLEKGDWEAHLVLRNHTPEGSRWQAPFSLRGPDVSTVRDDQYRAVHRMTNMAYGGEAEVRIEVTAPTLLQTSLRFELLSPSDRSLGNWTLGGTPLASDTRTFKLPLDDLLEYRWRVTGSLALAQYRISGMMTGPEEALLYFWWEDLQFGPGAIARADKCRGLVHGDLPEPAPLSIRSPDPKALDARVFFLGIGATLLTCLYVTMMVIDRVSTGSFVKTSRKG